MDSRINVTSNRYGEFNNKIEISGQTYDVQTEDLGIKKAKIITRIYSKGQIISTTTSDYFHLVKLPDLNDRIARLMANQHKTVIDSFVKEQTVPEKSKGQYAEEMKDYLSKGNKEAALKEAREALERFPYDPFFLSYCGYLIAEVENNPREGWKTCEEAIKGLKNSKTMDTAFFFPIFYLNLGRAYLKADRRKPAVKAITEGLKFSPNNAELLELMKGLGQRKSPVLPFLDRSHPLNVFLGKLRYRLFSVK